MKTITMGKIQTYTFCISENTKKQIKKIYIKFVKYDENLANKLPSTFNLTRHKSPNEKIHTTFNLMS